MRAGRPRRRLPWADANRFHRRVFFSAGGTAASATGGCCPCRCFGGRAGSSDRCTGSNTSRWWNGTPRHVVRHAATDAAWMNGRGQIRMLQSEVDKGTRGQTGRRRPGGPAGRVGSIDVRRLTTLPRTPANDHSGGARFSFSDRCPGFGPLRFRSVAGGRRASSRRGVCPPGRKLAPGTARDRTLAGSYGAAGVRASPETLAPDVDRTGPRYRRRGSVVEDVRGSAPGTSRVGRGRWITPCAS